MKERFYNTIRHILRKHTKDFWYFELNHVSQRAFEAARPGGRFNKVSALFLPNELKFNATKAQRKTTCQKGLAFHLEV